MTIDELKAEVHALHKRLAELDANIAALVVAPPEPEPEEQPERWPGERTNPDVGGANQFWYVSDGFRTFYGRTRAEAVANWNAAVMGQRLIDAGVRLTPEGWVEIVSPVLNLVRVYDEHAAQGICTIWRLSGESDADLVARLNAPAGTPIIRIRSKT